MGVAKTVFEGLNFQTSIEVLLFGPGNQHHQTRLLCIDTGQPWAGTDQETGKADNKLSWHVTDKNKAASRGPSSDAEISNAIGPERGGLQICDFTRS